MLDPEERNRGVQLAVQILALDPDLIILALDRIQVVAAAVAIVLRLEDACVAGVGRVGVVQVIDQAGIGNELGILLVALGRLGLPGGITAARDRGQAVRQGPAGSGIDAALVRHRAPQGGFGPGRLRE
ncbi:hypothetical protein D3C72_1901170 [compost metagenome]